MTLESNRLLGAIGSLFTVIASIASLLSLVQYVFPNRFGLFFAGPFGLLSLVGLILFMIAMNGLANYYKDRAIFNNALYWVLTSIVAGVVAVALSLVVVFSILSSLIGTLTPFTSANPPTLNAVLDAVKPYIVYFIPVGIVVFAIGVVSSVFMMRAFNRLADASGVRLFRTAGLLFLAGFAVSGALGLLAVLLILTGSIAVTAALPLVILSGFVSFAAWVLATMAFFRIRVPVNQGVPQSAPQTAAAASVKYCPNCGAENRADAIYCAHCGQKL